MICVKDKESEESNVLNFNTTIHCSIPFYYIRNVQTILNSNGNRIFKEKYMHNLQIKGKVYMHVVYMHNSFFIILYNNECPYLLKA